MLSLVSLIMDPLIPLLILTPIMIVYFQERLRYAEEEADDSDNLIADNLSSEEILQIGIQKLLLYVGITAPDYICCINRDGLLIGTYIALRTGIEMDRLISCVSNPKRGTQDSYDVSCEFNQKITGKILLISGVACSELLSDSTVNYIYNMLYESGEIHACALVAVIDETTDIQRLLDYHVFITHNKSFRYFDLLYD